VSLAQLPLKMNRAGVRVCGPRGMKLEAGNSLAMALLVHSSEDDIVMASKQGMMAMRCRRLQWCLHSTRQRWHRSGLT
jgi:hypothetical protein